MHRAVLFSAAISVFGLFALLLAAGPFNSPPAAHAVPGDVTLVAVDTTIAGNDDSAIGTIDSCASINVSDTLTFDLIVQGVDDADRIGGYQVDIDYDPSIISVTSVLDVDAAGSTAPNDVTIISRFVSSGGINFLGLSDWFTNASSMTLSAIDGTNNPAYPGMHEWGDGVLARVTVTAVGAGISNLEVGGPGGGSDGFEDVLINSGIPVGSSLHVTTVMDGQIAVGQSCGPTPTPSPSPSPSPTPTPTPIPTPTPTPTPVGQTPSPRRRPLRQARLEATPKHRSRRQRQAARRGRRWSGATATAPAKRTPWTR